MTEKGRTKVYSSNGFTKGEFSPLFKCYISGLLVKSMDNLFRMSRDGLPQTLKPTQSESGFILILGIDSVALARN